MQARNTPKGYFHVIGQYHTYNDLFLSLHFFRIHAGNLTELVMDVLDAHDEIYLIERIIAKEK